MATEKEIFSREMEVRSWKEGLNEAMAGVDWRWTLAIVVVTYIIYEQLSYMSKRKHLPGPTFVLPFVGSVISMVIDPTGFWDHQANLAKKVITRPNHAFVLNFMIMNHDYYFWVTDKEKGF